MYAVSSGLRRARNEDGEVILDVESGKIFKLNATASAMLELLDRGCKESQIIDEIGRQYGISATVATADLDSLLNHLEQLKLVRRIVQETAQ